MDVSWVNSFLWCSGPCCNLFGTIELLFAFFEWWLGLSRSSWSYTNMAIILGHRACSIINLLCKLVGSMSRLLVILVFMLHYQVLSNARQIFMHRHLVLKVHCLRWTFLLLRNIRRLSWTCCRCNILLKNVIFSCRGLILTALAILSSILVHFRVLLCQWSYLIGQITILLLAWCRNIIWLKLIFHYLNFEDL